MSATRTLGLVGRKAGMTRVFSETGETIPVTVIEALPNRITQVRTAETDGYRALQVAFGERKASHLSKPETGHYAKSKVAPGEALVEFRLTGEEGKDLAAGGELKVDLFKAGQIVDVTGTTTGKGFAGVMKRHNFAGGYASHGVLRVAPGRPARSANVRRLVACFPASACPDTWACADARSRTCRSCASMRSAIFSWSRRSSWRSGRAGHRSSLREGRRPAQSKKKAAAPAKK